MKKGRQIYWESVETSYRGKTYKGEFSIQGDRVVLRSPHGGKETQQGNSPAEVVAERLLRELIVDFDKTGDEPE